jgi:L-lactate utilization protein LutB
LMGIERLVPTLADLADLVAVLPRASSGQSMTVYASLIHGPRRPDDPDGPQERHLVLVDNGRSRLQSGPLAEALACIRCGACLNACPVFREIGGHAYVGAQGQASVYSGPIGSVIAPGLFGTPIYGSLARASSLCGACREACPVGIDLPELLLRVRAGQAETSPASPGRVPEALAWGLRLFAWAAASAGRFRLAQKMAGFAGSLLGGGRGWLRLPAFTGWGYAKDFPQPAWYTFQERFQKRPQPVLKEPDNLPPVEEYPQVQAAQTVQAGEAVPSLIDRFEQELVALGGEFFRCHMGELPAYLLGKIEAEGGQQVWAWDENNLPAGLLAELGKLGVKITHQADPAIKIGLTGALAAAAETGTLALPGGAGRPLQASLLPEIHLAVLHASRIHWSLADLLALPEMTRSSAAALVSGPSRTGDIELTLTVGVHGPGKVVVFCVEV